jgi:RluA family pseudouridine synthase
LAGHREKLKRVTTPLPGKLPQDNFRPLNIHARHDGWTLLDCLCDLFDHVPRPEWLARFEAEDIVDSGHRPLSASHQVRAGERTFTRERLQIEPDVNTAIDILHEDEALIVINKPAPLPMHPSGRFHRNTLEWFLKEVYAPQKPRPAHRLDANTSGVAVFTRTRAFAQVLQPQFEQGVVEKRYLARVIGLPPEQYFRCDAPIAANAGPHGSRTVDLISGLSALTEFEVLERYPDGTSLLMVTPRTGRTNQIRVHLWHLGWPIAGDAMYLPNQQLGDMQTTSMSCEPLKLLSWKLTFKHPLHGKPVTFCAPTPLWD